MKKKMDFGEALRALKAGERVARRGWNGKRMYLFLLADIIPAAYDEADYEPCIVMFTAQKKYQPGWLASQADMLAEDWQVVPARPRRRR